MIVILNGHLASGKTFLCKKLKDDYTIIDEDEKEVQAALSLHKNTVDLERAFSYLQIKKLQALVAAFKREPKRPIIYISSIFYTTQVYWSIPEKNETLESALILNREIRAFRHIEQTLLALMGQYYEIRLNPNIETILHNFKRRGRPNEFCPDALYIQSLKNREKKVPPLARHTILKNNEISASVFAQIIKVSNNKILSPGLISMTIEQYEKFFPQSVLIKLYLEILYDLLKFWDKMNLQDVIGGILPALPLILIKDIKILEKIFISLMRRHFDTVVESVNLLASLDCECDFPINILKISGQDCLFIFEHFCSIETTERLFEEISTLTETNVKLIHVLFEGAPFLEQKVFL